MQWLCGEGCPHLGCPLLCGGSLSGGSAVPALQPPCAPSAAVRATKRRRGAPTRRCCAGGEAAAPELLQKKRGTPREEPWGSPHRRIRGGRSTVQPQCSQFRGVGGSLGHQHPAPAPGLCCSGARAAPGLGRSSLLCPNEKNKCHLLLYPLPLLLLPLKNGSSQPGRC